MTKMPSLMIGIAGGTGSGKTTLARRIVEALPAGTAALIYTDSYYRPLTHLSPAERATHNFDHPDAIEFELLLAHLSALRDGQPIEVPIYNFSVHDREPQTEHIEPARVIVVEGILALQQERLRPFYDLTIFVDTPAQVRFDRRLCRDIRERGRTEESVRKQWQTTVAPMHDQYCEPSRAHARVIVDGQSDFSGVIAQIFTALGIS